MRGIERQKHEHLLQCLEELCLYTIDSDKGKELEAKIATLTEIYERYISFIQEVGSLIDRYHSLYRDMQVNTYKELRRVRRKQKK
ncbi:hypothetical protein [Dysgonomonas sp. BGC7]|uniref:hypothetical protein n=1 Tax=Dysgonomonas sp. BGC7 TaxID=1658008 RepID=UPI0006819437|nr:hypothetical protein [Dysgonomonas sp. BGC7]MBD8387768.1 hypothetical protein [Dysgonomonas sp. BGC7]